MLKLNAMVSNYASPVFAWHVVIFTDIKEVQARSTGPAWLVVLISARVDQHTSSLHLCAQPRS